MMKKLLFTVTSALLFNFTNSGYASPDINGLNDLPDEIKLHIGLQLSTDDQKNLGMVNRSFNAIMADDTVLTQKTARELGIEFSHIDQFSKDFFKNVREGNVTIDHLDYIEKPHIMKIDDSGYIAPINYPTCYDYHDLLINRAFKTTCISSDQNVLAGSRREMRKCYPDNKLVFEENCTCGRLANGIPDVEEQKYRKIAVKYIADENRVVDLLPGDRYQSYAFALNKDGSIIVGTAQSHLAKWNPPFGFVYKKDIKNPINLDFSQTEEACASKLSICSPVIISYPLALSDAGEIVAGFLINSKCQPILHIGQHNTKFHEMIKYQPDEEGNSIHNDFNDWPSIMANHTLATIWLHELNGDLDRYHPCSLKDLVMYNCADTNRTSLQYVIFVSILAISPNGKAMLVCAQYGNDMPYDMQEDLGDSYYKEFFLKIVFGSNLKMKGDSNIEPEVKDVTVFD